MKKSFVFVLAAFSAAVVFARVDSEKAAAGQMRVFGGKIADRRQAKGSLAVVNAQKAVKDAVLLEAIRSFNEMVCVETKLEKGAFDLAAPQVKGEATLFVVEDEKLPMSLLALESRWALVNVARLRSEKPVFFEARVKKEIYRVLAYLTGVGTSRFPGCITGFVGKAEDLDQITELKMPVEFMQRFEKYLPEMGIVPYRMVPYRRAVQEGWAPQPTNEFQKAIWDKVHELPTNPIKIEKK